MPPYDSRLLTRRSVVCWARRASDFRHSFWLEAARCAGRGPPAPVRGREPVRREPEEIVKALLDSLILKHQARAAGPRPRKPPDGLAGRQRKKPGRFKRETRLLCFLDYLASSTDLDVRRSVSSFSLCRR